MEQVQNTQFEFKDENLSKAELAEMELYNKFELSQLEQHYDRISENYEAIHERAGYPDPEECAKLVEEFTYKDDMSPGDVEILDFGCGTGLLGQCLNQKGFRNVTGIDISDKMLELAGQKNSYKKLEKLLLGQEKFQESFPYQHRNKYDFATASNLIVNDFETEKIFEQMILSLRPGGMMVFSTKFSYLGNYWYSETLESLEKQGRIQALGCKEAFQFSEMKQSVGKFTKTPIKIFVYRKTEEDSIMSYAMQNVKQRLQKGLQQKFSSMTVSTANSE